MKLKTFLKSAIAGFTAFAMIVAMLPANSLGNVKAASTDGNMILHWDMTINEDGSLKDLTGNNHKGIITGAVQPGTIDDINVVDMSGSDTSHPGYVTIPNGTITSDMTELTINMLVKTTKNNPGNWMWTIGSNASRYLYFTGCSSKNQHEKMRGGACYDAAESGKGWEHESIIEGTAAIAENVWQNMTVTYKDNGEFIFYKNGELQNRTTLSAGAAGTFTLQQLMTSTDAYDGYMGHSFYDWNGDPDFQGKVADFRIYNKEMSQDEVTELYDEIDAMLKSLEDGDFTEANINLTETDCLGTNEDKDHIIANLVLPQTTTIGIREREGQITKWVSSNPEVITIDGTVTRPLLDTVVTMTATVERKGISADKTLTFTLPGTATPDDLAQYDLDAISIPNKEDIRGNITLPAKGAYGSTITWTSSNDAVINSKDAGKILAGAVTRQEQDTEVTLTASVVNGNSAAKTKTFTCNVKKAYDMPETTDYIFTYFPYADTQDERIYFGISEDGLNFSALNNKKFILESKLGTHGLRDPFIIRSHEGDKFYIIATDLTVFGLTQDGQKYPGPGWGPCQTEGSQSIMIWESTDLVNWSEQRECKIAKDNAGCTWAPEAYWDDETEQYVVFWASKTGDDNYGNQRLYYATTRDFYQFSEPQVWIGNSGSVIDTTVIKVGEYYYRYTKNEGGSANSHGTPSKHVYCERSKSLTATEWEFVYKDSLAEGETWAIEGPCIYKFNEDDRTTIKNLSALKGITLDDTKDIYGLIADRNGNYIFPGVSDDITAGRFSKLGDNKSATVDGTSIYAMPEPTASHGTIMPITSEEYHNLMMEYGPADYKEAAPEIYNKANETAAAFDPQLPSATTSDLTLSTTVTNNAEVTWKSSNSDVISNTGVVTRPADEDMAVKLTATITLESDNTAVRDQVIRKHYTVTVPYDRVAKADAAKAAFNPNLPTETDKNLTLPTAPVNGAIVTWQSSNPAVISNTGVVTRPSKDTKVTLTATLTVNGNTALNIPTETRTATYDVTVKKAIPAKYTVTFDSKGGSKVASKTVESGKKVAKPKNPTKKGYTFAGWLNGTKAYNFNSAVTQNLTLTAKWTKVTVKAPSKPTLKNSKSKQMTVTIKKVSGAAGYQVTYSTDKKFKKKVTKKDITKNTLTIKKLKKNTTYYVKVKAYKKDSTGKKVYSSKFSGMAKIKIKK